MMVIGKGSGPVNVAAGLPQAMEKFLGPADPGKGEDGLPLKCLPLDRFENRAHHRTPAGNLVDRVPGSLPNQDNIAGAGQPAGYGFPQGASRDHEAVPKSVSPIHNNQGQVLGNRRILEAIVEDDACGACVNSGTAGGSSILGNPGRCLGGEKQGLIAHLIGIMLIG